MAVALNCFLGLLTFLQAFWCLARRSVAKFLPHTAQADKSISKPENEGGQLYFYGWPSQELAW